MPERFTWHWARAKAEKTLRAARDELTAIGDTLHESRALFYLAKLANERGDSQGALQQLDAALKIDETLRAEMIGSELRSSYFATIVEQYKLRIAVLMRLHKTHPGLGYDVQAFETSERARARSLLDLLSESAGAIRGGVDPELLHQERIVRARLRAKGERQVQFLSVNDAAKAEANEADVRSLVTQYRDLETRVQRESPRYAAFVDPQPLTLTQLRRGISTRTRFCWNIRWARTGASFGRSVERRSEALNYPSDRK